MLTIWLRLQPMRDAWGSHWNLQKPHADAWGLETSYSYGRGLVNKFALWAGPRASVFARRLSWTRGSSADEGVCPTRKQCR
jgi:hypothetical protein